MEILQQEFITFLQRQLLKTSAKKEHREAKAKKNIRALMMQLITCTGIRQKQGRLRLIESQKFQVACGEKAKMSEMSPISELSF